MFGSVAAGPEHGGHASIEDAARAMARRRPEVYRPIAANRLTYDDLYREYVRLHDYFGRGENDVMKTLRALRSRAKAGAPVAVEA
jgi:L-ribulokinase